MDRRDRRAPPLTRPALAGLIWLNLLGTSPLQAQTPPPTSLPVATAPPQALSLAQAQALAQAHNPRLSAARREVEALEGLRLQSQARPNPSLAYALEDARSHAPNNSRSQSWQLSLPLELGGQRSARISAADAAHAQALADLQAAQAALRADVASAFFDSLAGQARVELARGDLALARAATEAAQRRVSAGKIAPLDATKARVAESAAQVALAQAGHDAQAARARLAVLLGPQAEAPDTVAAEPPPGTARPEGKPSASVGDAGVSRWMAPWAAPVSGTLDALPEPPTPAQISERLSQAPALQRARLEVDRRRALAELERARQVPDLTLSVGVKQNADAPRQQLLLGVSLPLPVFDRNQGALLEALRREDQARDELQAQQQQLRSEALQAAQRLQLVRQELAVWQTDLLPAARSAHEAARIGFEQGKFSFLEVLDAQRTLVAAQTQLLKAQADAHRAAAELDRLLGADAPSTSTPSAEPGPAAAARPQ